MRNDKSYKAMLVLN